LLRRRGGGMGGRGFDNDGLGGCECLVMLGCVHVYPAVLLWMYFYVNHFC
jgi:hypothetical protein